MDDTRDLQHERDRTKVDYPLTNETSSVTPKGADDDVVLTQTPGGRASAERATLTATDPRELNREGTSTVMSGSHQPIEQVREDMKVIDVNGDDIGKVAAIKLGDPEAATVSPAEQLPDDTLVDQPLVAAPITTSSTGVLAAPIAPAAIDDEETIDPNLLRIGYIRVDAKGWFNRDLLVPADAITSVTADTVTISLAKDDLAKE